jgi:hypothetical protein
MSRSSDGSLDGVGAAVRPLAKYLDQLPRGAVEPVERRYPADPLPEPRRHAVGAVGGLAREAFEAFKPAAQATAHR